MGDLGVQDGYPAGVSNADPHFHTSPPDDFGPCQEEGCGHDADDHDWEGRCKLCGCPAYAPKIGALK